MENSASQKQCINLSLTTSQLQLINKALDNELHAHESGFSHFNPRLLKTTFDQFYDLLKLSNVDQHLSHQLLPLQKIVTNQTLGLNHG